MVDKVVAIPRSKITGRAGVLAAGPLKDRGWAGTGSSFPPAGLLLLSKLTSSRPRGQAAFA